MGRLRFQLEGRNAAGTADEFEKFFKENFGERPTRLQSRRPPELGERGELVEVAALILTVPGAILATIQLADRYKVIPKLEKLIELAKRECKERGTTIRIEISKDRLESLDRLDANRIIDTAVALRAPQR